MLLSVVVPLLPAVKNECCDVVLSQSREDVPVESPLDLPGGVPLVWYVPVEVLDAAGGRVGLLDAEFGPAGHIQVRDLVFSEAALVALEDQLQVPQGAVLLRWEVELLQWKKGSVAESKSHLPCFSPCSRRGRLYLSVADSAASASPQSAAMRVVVLPSYSA